MTFTWETPPWLRNEDCTYMAVLLVDAGGGEIAVTTESVRGETATEALADLVMGPGGGGAALPQRLIGVVVREGIDVMWMAQPPIHVASAGDGQFDVGVDEADASATTMFSSQETYELAARLKAAYS